LIRAAALFSKLLSAAEGANGNMAWILADARGTPLWQLMTDQVIQPGTEITD